MKTNYFLDILFDLINESDTLNVREIEADLRSDALHCTLPFRMGAVLLCK